MEVSVWHRRGLVVEPVALEMSGQLAVIGHERSTESQRERVLAVKVIELQQKPHAKAAAVTHATIVAVRDPLSAMIAKAPVAVTPNRSCSHTTLRACSHS